ncbi:uncharacterized protein LOC107363181 [Tetranychus urticae]|nr:uncharacterized protein LOC107363181 [Tetranychus urticae]
MSINWSQLITLLIFSNFIHYIQSSSVCAKLQQCQSETIPMISQQSNFGDPKWPLTYTCRNLRDNLDCLLSLSPYCDRRDSLTSQTTWTLVYKSKIYLDQKCDRESGIMDSPCYRSNEVKKCENLNPSPGSINQYNCWRYNRFRDCVHSSIRTTCTPQEQNLVNQYLVDRSKNMSWLCVNMTTQPSSQSNESDEIIVGTNRKVSNEPLDKERLSSSSASTNDRDMTVSGQFIGYPTVVGPPVINGEPFPGPAPYPPNDGLHGGLAPDRIPIGGRYPYPGSSGTGLYPGYGSQPYDSVRPNYPTGSMSVEICLERSRYLAQHCENALLQSQRIAHHYRTPSEVQRVICCGLFYYRDCMYQVLNHVCPGSDPLMFSMVLPFTVNQQLATCRSYTRGQCSNGINHKSSFLTILLSIFTFSWIYSF